MASGSRVREARRQMSGSGIAGDDGTSVRVLVVDDHAAMRAGLGAVLEAEPGMVAVGAVATAREALEAVEQSPPDIALLDYHLPDEDGLSLCLRLKGKRGPPRVVIYSAFADASLALAAVIAGADGIVSKSARPEELCEAIRNVAEGRAMMPALVPETMEESASRLDADDLPILGMLVHRTPADEIAAALGLTEAWLSARRWAMLGRLRGQAARRTRPDRAGHRTPSVGSR